MQIYWAIHKITKRYSQASQEHRIQNCHWQVTPSCTINISACVMLRTDRQFICCHENTILYQKLQPWRRSVLRLFCTFFFSLQWVLSRDPGERPGFLPQPAHVRFRSIFLGCAMTPLRGDAGDPGPGGRARGPSAENGPELCAWKTKTNKPKNRKTLKAN